MVTVTASTALQRLPPLSYLAGRTFFLKQGTKLDVDAMRAQLAVAGYTHVTQVVSPGEFSVRGGLIDLFPMGSALPYRLDLFGDEIETIRTFDVDTQRTLYPVPDVRLLPAREFPLDEAGRTRFRGRFREVFEGDPSRSPLYKDVSNGIVPGGLEYYLPLFFDATATFLDYLPQDPLVVLHGDVAGALDRFWQDTESRYRLLRGDKARPLLPPSELFVPPDGFRGALKSFARIDLPVADAGAALPPDAPTRRLPAVVVDRRAEDPLAALKRALAAIDGRVLIVAESAGRRETMQQYFREYGLEPQPSGRHRGVPAGRREARRSRPRRSTSASSGRPRSSRSSPRRSSTPTWCAAAAATPAGARTSTRWCATSPRCASATRSCTSSTASAATSASPRSTWATVRTSSSSSSTRTTPSCTCRCRRCT